MKSSGDARPGDTHSEVQQRIVRELGGAVEQHEPLRHVARLQRDSRLSLPSLAAKPFVSDFSLEELRSAQVPVERFLLISVSSKRISYVFRELPVYELVAREVEGLAEGPCCFAIGEALQRFPSSLHEEGHSATGLVRHQEVVGNVTGEAHGSDDLLTLSALETSGTPSNQYRLGSSTVEHASARTGESVDQELRYVSLGKSVASANDVIFDDEAEANDTVEHLQDPVFLAIG